MDFFRKIYFLLLFFIMFFFVFKMNISPSLFFLLNIINIFLVFILFYINCCDSFLASEDMNK